MKRLPLLLFILGILMEVTAFFIGNVEQVPLLFIIISPSYYNANKGLEKLREQKILEPRDKGFLEISNIFMKVVSKQNPPEIVEKISPSEFVRKGAYQAFSVDRVKEVIEVDVKLSNGKVVEWDINEIAPLVDEMKYSNTFKCALVIFSLGVIIQIVGYGIGKINLASNHRLESAQKRSSA